MMFERDGDDLLVIVSNVGAPAHPDWYLNLARDARVTTEVGEVQFDAVAVTISGDRRERVWSMLKQRYPFFADHEAKTSRIIPVVALTKREHASASRVTGSSKGRQSFASLGCVSLPQAREAAFVTDRMSRTPSA